MVKLFVGGFPLEMQELELVQMFGLYGDVSTIKIVRDRATGKCKGFAFIEMTSQSGAEAAIEALDGKPMQDRELAVRITEEKPVKVAPQRTYRKPEINTSPVRPKRPRRTL